MSSRISIVLEGTDRHFRIVPHQTDDNLVMLKGQATNVVDFVKVGEVEPAGEYITGSKYVMVPLSKSDLIRATSTIFSKLFHHSDNDNYLDCFNAFVGYPKSEVVSHTELAAAYDKVEAAEEESKESEPFEPLDYADYMAKEVEETSGD